NVGVIAAVCSPEKGNVRPDVWDHIRYMAEFVRHDTQSATNPGDDDRHRTLTVFRSAAVQIIRRLCQGSDARCTEKCVCCRNKLQINIDPFPTGILQHV